jgi:hypothetical protein
MEAMATQRLILDLYASFTANQSSQDPVTGVATVFVDDSFGTN